MTPADLTAARELAQRLNNFQRVDYDDANLAAALLTLLADEVERQQGELDALQTKVYVPGLWTCAKCKLVLVASSLNIHSGAVSANTKPQECANGCGPMWMVTERDQRKECQQQYDKLLDKVERLERDAAQSEQRGFKAGMERASAIASNHAAVCVSNGHGEKARTASTIADIIDAALKEQTGG